METELSNDDGDSDRVLTDDNDDIHVKKSVVAFLPTKFSRNHVRIRFSK